MKNENTNYMVIDCIEGNGSNFYTCPVYILKIDILDAVRLLIKILSSMDVPCHGWC